MNALTTVECPRDAMQGWPRFIPTDVKIAYLNQLLEVGFDVLDFGSFVSAKAIPQLADTAEVLAGLDLEATKTELLAIVANTRGATDAAAFPEIRHIGFPFSISETFQMRNTRKTMAESLTQLQDMQQICAAADKKLVVYLSMGFGNPYGDPFDESIVLDWFTKLAQLGLETIALADTVGVARPEMIKSIFERLIPEFPEIEIGAHFHARPDQAEANIEAAYQAGCRRFDTSLKGIGGCPMAEDKLVGNIATEKLIAWADNRQIPLPLNRDALHSAQAKALQIFQT